MDAETLDKFSEVTQLFNVTKIILMIGAIYFFWFANKLIRASAEWMMRKAPSKRFMILQSATLFTFLWYFFAIYIVIAFILKPPKELMLALMGSIIVATGIALKDVAASIISGLILLFERPFQVGDRVRFREEYGEIISIGLRSVRLNTLSDDIVTIPNSAFVTDTVSTGNSGALDMMIVCDFHLALDANIEQAQSIIHEVLVTSRYIYMNKPIKFVVSEEIIAERLALKLTAKAYVFDVRYEKNFQTDVFQRASHLFIKHGISRPLR